MISVWVNKYGFDDYRMGHEAEAASVVVERENKTINLFIPIPEVHTVYEHIDYHEFLIQKIREEEPEASR